MQSDVLNEQQQLSNDTDSSSTLSTPTATTLIYSGLKLHPKPLVPTISMPGVASPLSIVKKLSLPDSHIDNNVRHSSSTNSTPTNPSSIRLVTPTNKPSSSFQVTDKSTTNGTFSTSKTYILNPSQSSTTTVNKQQILPNSNSSSLLTLIPPGTTSPKIQTLNSVTISSTNDMSTTDKSSTNQSVFLSKNRVTLVQPIITNSTSSSSTTTNSSPKLVIQQNTNSSTTNNHFWQQQQQTQPTKIFSIPQTATKMLSRPVQLIPTSDHHLTHVKTDNPTLMHFGLSSPTTNENPLTKSFDTSGHQAYIHMQVFPSTSNSDLTNSSQQSLQFTLPSTTHLYSSPSSVLISTTQRSMDHNNNHHHHHHHQSTITTPIIREIQTEEKLNKNRARLPLQPSIQQTIRLPKKHKLNDDYSLSSSEPPHKLPHYEQLDSSKKLSKSHHRHFAIENTTPISIGIEPTGITKKSYSSETNPLIRKRRKLISNENIKQESIPNRISDIVIDQIDDELLKRLSQDFVYTDKRTGIRWIGRKTRPKAMSTLVSRFSWKPKINHYEKYSDIIRTNPKRIVPVKSLDSIRKKLTQPWASWRIDRLTSYLSDLTHDEQMAQNQLSDLNQILDIDDPSIRTTIQDLIEANIQRHRCFCDQLSQISSLLVNLLDHGNTLRDICSVSKSSTTKRTKER